MSAADIDDGAKSGEVVRRSHRLYLRVRCAGHALVEDGGEFRLVVQPLEYRLAAQRVDAGPAGVHRIGQMSPTLSVVRMPEEQHDATHGCRCVGAQGIRHRRRPEPVVAMDSEDSSAREHPEQAAYRIGFAPT
jgi:hypothetical protein